jgi:gamma-glutamyl-gamma-aminobutyraldehyde dehydrogenase
MSLANLENYDHDKWQTVAGDAEKRIETRLYIDGGFVDAADGGRFTTVNPASGEAIEEMSEGSAKDIDTAVSAAMRAYKSGVWSRMAPRDRMEVLYRFADLVAEQTEELAVLETLDMGKPISDVINDDIPAVIATIRFMAECIDKIEALSPIPIRIPFTCC